MSAPADSTYTLVREDGTRERLRSCRIFRFGAFPLVLWLVERTWPPDGVVAHGWARSRRRALAAAHAWLDREPW